MDLLRLGSAVAQQEQLPAPVLPALAESLEQLANLETAELSAVKSGSGAAIPSYVAIPLY